jgi:4-diphosphocytidyl-2-C-methyl-D-erythritol kinase
MTVSVRSFAKINVGLRIGGARADGFHELLTVYQTIGLHDLMRVSLSPGSGIEIRCSDPRVPKDESNTCYRVVEKAMRALEAKGQRVLIEIEKRLPLQGGMGGASANAAATLLALEKVVKKSLSARERLRIAAEVGSDLPLFLVGGTVLGVGRGEQVYPLEDLPETACVVVTPPVGVSTPNAFGEWDRTTRGAGTSALLGLSAAGRKAKPGPLTLPGASDRMDQLGCEFSAWLSESYSGAPFRRGRAENPLLALVRAGIKNDFEEVVFPAYPELSEGKRALERAGASYASLSGSGSTLYGLYASRASARVAAAKLRRQGWTAQATVTLTRQKYWAKFLVPSF